MQKSALYQDNRQQLLMFGATIFASITAAVIVSTVIIMSLMRGEIAGALASTVQNSSPTTQMAGSCVVPAESTNSDTPEASTASATSSNMAFTTGSTYLHHKWPIMASVNNSFNNTSTTTTTNNVTNTEVHNKTVIKDSFNDNSTDIDIKIKDSFNPVIIKDNEVNVNSNNNTAVNSGNTTNTTNTTNTVVNTTSNVNSNNVTNVASNNTVENHVLSDNTVIAPLVALPL